VWVFSKVIVVVIIIIVIIILNILLSKFSNLYSSLKNIFVYEIANYGYLTIIIASINLGFFGRFFKKVNLKMLMELGTKTKVKDSNKNGH